MGWFPQEKERSLQKLVREGEQVESRWKLLPRKWSRMLVELSQVFVPKE
jgi:hypothetical protein